jgi:type IV pilus assembly protein PilV
MKRLIANDFRFCPFGRSDGMKRKFCLRRQEGWTLIEILIAIVVLTVGLLAVGTMQISAIRGNFMGGNTSIALSLASQKMEDLFNQPYREDGDLAPGVHPPEPQHVSDTGETGTGFYRRSWTITDSSSLTGNWPDMKQIEIIVSWENDRHRVNLRSMRMP